MTAKELGKRICQMSTGVGAVVVMRRDDWQSIRHAYGDTPLLRGISERAALIEPIAFAGTRKIEFREGLVPPGPLMAPPSSG